MSKKSTYVRIYEDDFKKLQAIVDYENKKNEYGAPKIMVLSRLLELGILQYKNMMGPGDVL